MVEVEVVEVEVVEEEEEEKKEEEEEKSEVTIHTVESMAHCNWIIIRR